MAADPVGPRRDGASPPSGGSPDAEIGAFVEARLSALHARLAQSPAQPADDATLREVGLLRDLTELAASTKKAPPSQPRQRFLVPGLFLATAVVMTALVFVRLPGIRIDADVLCSGLTFRTASPIQLTSLSRLTLLQASAFAPIDISDAVSERTVALTPPLELRPTSQGTLTLSSITIPGDALVSLHRTDDPGTWHLTIEHGSAAVSATAAGLLDVTAGGLIAQPVAFGRGSPVQLRTGGGDLARLDLHVTPQRVDSLLAGRLLPVSAVVFDESVDDSAPGTFGVMRGRGSSVLDGSVFNVSLAGRESKLRPRDSLEIDLTSADVRELRPEPNGLRVSLSGLARDLRVGRAGGLQTLRPSYLEWLAEHNALQLAWGAAAWLFALFLGGMKWWQQFGTA